MKMVIWILICLVSLKANDLVNMTLNQFTDRVSKQTLKSIYIDEDINSSISLYVPNKISNKDIFLVYKSTLQKNNYYLKRVGKVYILKKKQLSKVQSHLYNLKFNSFQDSKMILDALQVKYTYLKDSNSFLILSTNEKYKTVKNYLFQVDKKQSQITLKIMILEYQSSLTHEQGIEFGSVYKNIDGITKSAINAIVAPITNNTLSISKFNFYSALHLLNSKNLLHVKQFPYILAKNNEKFVFEAVQNIPYLVKTTTTENANTSEQTSIEYRDVGLKINGLPFIYDNYISLKLDLIIEDLISNNNETNTPETYKRHLNSSTDLIYNNVLLLSGIKRIKHSVTHIEIPILSKIPYIGEIFKYDYKTDKNLNLTIAIEIVDNKKAMSSIRLIEPEAKEVLGVASAP